MEGDKRLRKLPLERRTKRKEEARSERASELLMWEVTFQRSLSHTAPPLSSSSRRRRRRYPFFRDRDESTLSKTHYKLDKLVVSSKCALLLLLPLLPCHTPPQPQGRLSSLARPLHSRVTTLKRGPSRPPWILAQRMELGVPRNGDFTAGSSLSPSMILRRQIFYIGV